MEISMQQKYLLYSVQVVEDCNWVEKYMFPVMWYKKL